MADFPTRGQKPYGDMVKAYIDAQASAAILVGKSAIPVWADRANRNGQFDTRKGIYMPASASGSLQKIRSQLAKALAKTATAHIAIHGDSQSMGLDPLTAWPRVLGNKLAAYYGSAGSGIRFMYDHWEGTWVGSSFTNPAAYGTFLNTYGGGSAKSSNTIINGTDYIQFTATDAYDYVVVYGHANGANIHVQRNATANSANQWAIDRWPGDSASAPSGWTKITAQNGYSQKTPVSTNGGQVVGVITPSSPVSGDTFKIMNDGTYPVYVEGFEFRKNESRGGVRVTNVALSGKTLREATTGFDGTHTAAQDISDDRNGMQVSIDMVRADLAVFALSGTNDWNSFKNVPDYKTELTTAVQRQRATTVPWNGTAANGDAVLVVMPEMDYSWYADPANGQNNSNNPTYRSYMQANYEVADEQGVPLIDLGWRWQDHAKALALGIKRDWVHPSNPVGDVDYAEAIFNGLMTLFAAGA